MTDIKWAVYDEDDNEVGTVGVLGLIWFLLVGPENLHVQPLQWK